LSAQVFGHPSEVDSSSSRFEDSPVVFVVEIEDVTENGVGNIWVDGEVQKGLFQPSQIAVQQERFVLARVYGPVSVVMFQVARDCLVIEIVGAGPIEGVDLLDAVHMRQRMKTRFVVSARAIVGWSIADSPNVGLRVAGVMRQKRRRLDQLAFVDPELLT
jgi:hypothetical protein